MARQGNRADDIRGLGGVDKVVTAEEGGLNHIENDVFRIDNVVKQMRYFKNYSEDKSFNIDFLDRLPKFTSTIDAALWIRKNGNYPLTNQTFKGLLGDLVGRSMREEEYLIARLHTSPTIRYLNELLIDGFITKEEKEEFIIELNEKRLDVKVKIIDTILGSYISEEE